MKIRPAKAFDVEDIYNLVREHAELDRMLFRTPSYIYEHLQQFIVAELADDTGKVVGCCALQILSADLAEIKSLAVDSESKGRGIGKALVEVALNTASDFGLAQVFTLTLEPGFFQKLGFAQVSMDTLPMKVWSDCAKCPKQENCDEVALVFDLKKA